MKKSNFFFKIKKNNNNPLKFLILKLTLLLTFKSFQKLFTLSVSDLKKYKKIWTKSFLLREFMKNYKKRRF